MDFKSVRDEKKLTLDQVAELSGWSVAAINGLELHGKGSLRLRKKLEGIYTTCKPCHDALHDAATPAQETEVEIWKRRAKKAEAELHDLKTKLREFVKTTDLLGN